LVAFFSQAPTAFIAPLAGVLVDRWDRQRTIVATQILAMLQSAALAALAFTNTLSVWHLVLLGTAQAVINAFDMPARQSFVRDMVDDRADLANAIALSSTLVNGARLLGPVVAAALIGLVGVGWCFAIDAASYVAVIASLVAMRITRQPVRVHAGRVADELREGIRYVRSVPMVQALLLLLAATSVFAGGYTSMLPALAQGTMDGGPVTLGLMMGAAGAGSLVGGFYLALRETVVGLGTVIANCAVALGVALMLLEVTPTVQAALPILFVVGLTLMVQWTATNTLVQTVVDHDKLGRAMSLYAVAFFGGAPIGSLMQGAIAGLVGPVHAFALFGVACVVSALLFRRAIPALRRITRPRYVELGLIED
jgi:MFS family permease